MINIVQEGLFKVAKKYNNIVLLYSDEEFPGANFLRFFTSRSFNLGLGEQNLVSSAAGFIVQGKMPLVFGKSSMAMKAFAQIRDNICVPNLNVKFIVIGEEDFSDVEIIKSLPNIKIVCPQNNEEIFSHFDEMVDSYGPVYFRLRF